MRKKYGNGGKSLTKAQKTLPPALNDFVMTFTINNTFFFKIFIN